jgi:hypothetical protein
MTLSDLLDGRNASSTSDLARALNREPADFAVHTSRIAMTSVLASPARVELL